MGVWNVWGDFQRPRQQLMSFFKPVQPGQHNTVIGQRFSIGGAEFYGVCEHICRRRQVAVGKQKSRQPDLVFSALLTFGADLIDHRHLCLDGLDKTSRTIMLQRRVALVFQALPTVSQNYRYKKICTAYK